MNLEENGFQQRIAAAGSEVTRRVAQLKDHWLRHKLQKLLKKGMLYFLLVDGAFIFLLPILYMLSLSFFTAEDLRDPSIRWIPVHFMMNNYRYAFQLLSYPKSLMTTLLTTSVAIFGQTIFCSLAGYALARLNFPGKKLMLGLVFMVLVIPTQALILPYYIFYLKLGLTRTLWPLILPEMLGNGLYGALFVFVFRQVFSGIPKDLEDAAAIDGAGLFKAFRLIMAPLAKTAYITVGLFSFVLHWNEYIRPLYFLGDQTRTLCYALSFLFPYNLQSGVPITTTEATRGAGIILVMAPVILIYILVQKYFIQGVQLTGIKG
jgi:multiple sugar transport system permease protein